MSETKTPPLAFFLRYLKPYAGPIALTLVFLTLARVASALEPVWLKKIIDGVTQGSPAATITTVVGIYFALRVASAAFDYLRDYAFSVPEMGIARSISRDLFYHLLTLPLSYHVDQKIGGTARKITRGSRAIGWILDFLVINILPTIIELIITTILLLSLYPASYGVITAATVIIYTWFTIWATEKRQKFRLAANEADDEVSGLEVDTLANIETVKYFNNEPVQRNRYEPLIGKRFGLNVSSNKLFALVAFGQNVILLIGLGLILLLAIRQTIANQLTIGDLVLLTTYIARLAGPIGVLGFIYRSIKDGLADLDGTAQILQTSNTVLDPEKPVTVKNAKGDVQFNNVSFEYGNGRTVLDGIDLDITPGKKVAFVGPSGAGKSTIVKLIFRLMDPTSGRITVDGVNLHELSKENRQELFAIVPQEPILFNASIAENIRFGNTEATQNQIEEAAKVANIHALIDSLPEKYETVVGERGVKLSGGEKQRVAIARAIIRNPKVLVFDEATSSLDSASEAQILGALDAAAKGRTTIAVAHRLSTIVHSDTIYVLKAGKVFESGTHQELLAKKGLYADLWAQQSHQNDAPVDASE